MYKVIVKVENTMQECIFHGNILNIIESLEFCSYCKVIEWCSLD